MLLLALDLYVRTNSMLPVISGSFSRSAVNYTAGANTMLSNIVLALATTVVVAAITPVFQYLPQSALAAIIIVAVIGLVGALPCS